MKFASSSSRLIAFLIDGVAITVISWLVAALLGGVIGLTAATGIGLLGLISGALALLTLAIMALFQFLYFGWMWSSSGQTVGMKLTNIKVVRRGTEGTIGFLAAGLRGTVGYYISGLVFSLGFIWILFDGNKEGWHDKIFNTWVIKAR